jgi:quinol monooxygenase YgiN
LNMSKITVVAKIRAKEESVETVRSELLNLVEPTRKEEGCIDYQLYQDMREPSVFVFYENWASAADLEKHKNTDHYERNAATVFELIEERVVNKLTKVA